MKRDMELIRRLMLDIEARPAGKQFTGEELYRDGDDRAIVAEHLVLLIEHGLVKGKAFQTFDGLELDHIMILSTTWKGHEFLDAVRNDTVWNKTKDKLASVGGTATVEIITQVASGLMKQMLGLGP